MKDRVNAVVKFREGFRPFAPSVLEEAATDYFERSYILAELKTNDWNVTRTADRLGIERSHLYRKLKAYNINPPKRDT